MTALKTVTDAMDELLTENAVPSVADQITATGLHPIEDGRSERRVHAAPWTAGQVYRDANDGLACYQSTGRRVDRSFIGGAMALLIREVDQAAWTITALGAGLPVTRLDDADWRTEAAYL